MKQPFLPLLADGNTLKLAVANDNSIVVAGGDSAAKFLSVVGLKICCAKYTRLSNSSRDEADLQILKFS